MWITPCGLPPLLSGEIRCALSCPYRFPAVRGEPAAKCITLVPVALGETLHFSKADLAQSHRIACSLKVPDREAWGNHACLGSGIQQDKDESMFNFWESVGHGRTRADRHTGFRGQKQDWRPGDACPRGRVLVPEAWSAHVRTGRRILKAIWTVNAGILLSSDLGNNVCSRLPRLLVKLLAASIGDRHSRLQATLLRPPCTRQKPIPIAVSSNSLDCD
jgi:hypothetical protein